MTINKNREAGLSLVETLVSITIFALMTMGIVPLLGTAMRGGAATRTESVGRNVAAKTLERLRGLSFHTPYSATPREVDLLDHFFPGRTPAYAPPATTTGFDAASNSFVTTCGASSTAAACSSLPDNSQIPAGYSVEIRLTFKETASVSTTVPVPATYAWNAAADADAPPSQLVEVGVTSAWTVGARQRTFNLTSYLGDRMRPDLPTSGSAAPSAPPGGGGGGGGGGGSSAPATVKLRAEAKIDYAVEGTATWQDTQSPPRKTEVTMTMGNVQAYGEQLDSGSQADLKVRAGTVRATRAADPAVSGDTGMDVVYNGAILDAHAAPDATSLATTTVSTTQTLNTTEVNAPTGMAYIAPTQAGTMSTATRGVGPSIAGGLPFVKGYYDFNGTTNTLPANRPTHMWLNPQYAISGAQLPGTANTENPYNLRTTTGSNTYKMFSLVDALSPNGQDPHGEVEIDSTATTTPSTRVVKARADITAMNIGLLPTNNIVSGASLLDLHNFRASVYCESRPDAAYPSTAVGSWAGDLFWHSDVNNNGSTGLNRYVTSLPTQTYTGNSAGPVPNGDTNPLQTIKNLNGGNGPLIYDNSNNTYDVYLFSGNGRRGVLKDWAMSSLQTSMSADERVISSAYNGILRMETNALRGPWLSPDSSTTYPDSEMTVSIGKLSCLAEDYR